PMGDDVRQALTERGIVFVDREDLESVLPEADVVYQTRIQRERFDSDADYQAARGIYVIGEDEVAQMKKQAILLHPLPRVNEISPTVDSDPPAAYFRKAHNCVYIRIALPAHLSNQSRGSTATGT